MSIDTKLTIATLVLIFLLSAITLVDYRRMVIPDHFNFALASSGLLFAAVNDFVQLPWQILSASTVLVSFWVMRAVHAKATGRIGLGLGDVKMAAAAATWMSPALFPLFLLLASASALFFFVLRSIVAGQRTVGERIPFGPFLAFALGVVWVFEHVASPEFWPGVGFF